MGSQLALPVLTVSVCMGEGVIWFPFKIADLVQPLWLHFNENYLKIYI